MHRSKVTCLRRWLKKNKMRQEKMGSMLCSKLVLISEKVSFIMFNKYKLICLWLYSLEN
jgi:hypothetical protein